MPPPSLNTPMHPKHDEDFQEELVPEPLFAGQHSKSQKSQECLDTLEEVETFLESFRQDMSELQIQEANHQSRELKAVPGDEATHPSPASLDLQELIDDDTLCVESSISGPHVPNPLIVRKPSVKQKNHKPSITQLPNVQAVEASNPVIPRPNPLDPSTKSIAHKWNGRESSVSTFVDYQIHQQLAQYQISSDPVSPKTPPISPKTPHSWPKE